MKKITLYLTSFLLAVGLLILYSSCQKVPNGFLTNYPYYDQSPMFIGKGYAFTSSPLETIGSTIPMRVKILHVHDLENGALMDSVFFKRYPLTIFTGYYDSKVDTTLAMIDAITKTVDTFPINVNSANGSFQTNFNTYYMPAGSYTFDLQITNPAGTKVYPKIAEFVLSDTLPYQSTALGAPYDLIMKVGDESVGKFAAVPIVTVNRIADTPNMVILKVMDKNGNPFDPAKGEYLHRPQPGNPSEFRPVLQDYGVANTITDTSINVQYPLVPFPIHTDPGGLGYNLYYRLPTQFVHFDEYPDNVWSANIKFNVRFFVPGEYTVNVQLPDVTRR
ncbi:MAG: hypothetical protein ACRDE2_07855 [Chitinophagaceae bacterium]